MPEIKGTFVAGRMNKNLDERLVPKGEYRNAMNIDISTSEESNVGAAQNCMGNSLIESTGISGAFCVGSIVDAKNDKIYWFISGTNVDAIAEYDPNVLGGKISPVFVDVKATSGGILNFSSAQRITGINVVDEYLFFTDNINEPKKININRSKQGCIKEVFIKTIDNTLTYDVTDNSVFGSNYDLTTKPSALNVDFTSSLAASSYNNSTGIITLASNPGNGTFKISLKLTSQFLQHTRLFVEKVNKGNVKEKHITVIKRYPLKAPTIALSSSDRDGNISNIVCSTPDESFDAAATNNFSFWAYKTTTGNVLPKPPGTNFDPSNLTDNLNRNVVLSEIEFQTTILKQGDIVRMEASDNGVDYSVVLELEEETTATNSSTQKFKCVIINISNSFANSSKDLALTWTVNVEQEDPIYELVFPRFAYRWRYVDGEYSALSPFTEVAFLPDEINGYEFDAKTGHNSAMKNIVRKITLSNFGDYMMAEDSDVVFLDIVMKESDKTNIYIIKSIDISRQEVQTVDITAESIKSLLPENQILRPFDNVPRKALAQEISGNRLVYANYVQGQKLVRQDALKIFTRPYSKEIKNNKPTASIKSIRDYEVGISYLDEYGRQTPVLVSKDGGSVFKIPQSRSDKDNYIRANVETPHPSFATHYKFYIKEPSEEYYNLPLDRYYLAEEEDTVWLSFVSADVNKVSANDYIILKKRHGSNQAVFIDEKTMTEDSDVSKTIKYKVLDKKSQAPDYIRNRKELIGKISTQFSEPDNVNTGFPIEQGVLITIPAQDVTETVLEDMHTLTSEKKYIKISISDSEVCSKYYEVESIEAIDGGTDGDVDDNDENDRYEIKIKNPFAVDISFTGTAANKTSNLQFELYAEKEEEYLTEEFQGRFFIKIKIDKAFDENVLQTGAYTNRNWVISHKQNIFNIVNADDGSTSSQSASVTFSETDFTPSYTVNGSALPGQEYAIDNAFGFEPTWNNGGGTAIDSSSPDYVTTSSYAGEPGKGWAPSTDNIVDLRFFGTKDPRTGFPVLASSFYPNTQPFYQKLINATAGNPVYCRWADEEPTNSNNQDPPIYKITNCVEIPVDNIADTSDTFGIRLRLKISEHDPSNPTANSPINWNPTTSNSNVSASSAYNDSNVTYDATGPDLTHAREFQILERQVDSRTFSTDSPAVFETEPKKLIDLNIFHETPEAILIPKVGMSLTSSATGFPNTTIASIGLSGGITKINMTNPVTDDIPNGTEVTFKFPASHESNTNFSHTYKVYGTGTGGQINNNTNQFFLKALDLNWYNVYSFGNGVESNRIRDDFNAPFIDNGPKVSTISEEEYKEERRTNGLIYSGLYNSNSDFNNLNQFIQAEKITKDLNPTYGSIQKLFSRNTNIVVFCEDKTLKILANKDALFNADGNVNLTSTNRFLGQTIPFAGEYGISKNPESFASYGYRIYYADKNRNAVLRLSGDGITNISDKGMSNYFKDNLYRCTRITGGYDEDKNLYNLTLQNSDLTINDTVSFTEKTNGWTSFKSFKPESSVSLNSKYYTFFNGDIYEHGANSLRNTFYGTFTDSSIKLIMNDMPSSIKEFKSLNYEGTESRLYDNTVGSETSLETDKNITNNAGKGWYANSIETDKQSGTIAEFKEKEGKWYSYIKGIDTTVSNIDTKEFSIQGLGSLSSISGVSWSVTNKLNITGKINPEGNSAGVLGDYMNTDREAFSWEETAGTSLQFDSTTGANDIIKQLNVANGSFSQSHVFNIVGNTVITAQNEQSKFLLSANDFAVDTTFNSGSEESSDPVISGGGIGTITFANSTTAYASDNKIIVTVPFSFTMPSTDQSISFRIKGGAIMTQQIT